MKAHAMNTFQAPALPVARRVTIGLVAATFCVASLWGTTFVGMLKVLTYSMPAIALIAVLAAGKLTIPPTAPPYMVLMVAGLAMAPLGKLRGLQDLWLMLMGLSPFLFGHQYKLTWRQVFSAVLISTVFSLALNRGHASSGIEFDPSKSVSSFEATTSFYFGVLSVWAALERKWLRTAVALILCVLTLKRIVVLAAVAAIACVLLPRRAVDKMLRPLPMLLMNVIAMIAIFGYTHGAFDQFISRTTGQSPDQLGMGRQALYAGPISVIERDPVKAAFIGVGPGGVYDVIKTHGGLFAGHQNLHNDSLKMLLEYGGVAWACFFVACYVNKRFEIRVLMLFTNVMMLTDNTLIYPAVIFCTALAATRLQSNDAGTAGGKEKAAPPLSRRRMVLAGPARTS